MGAWHVEALRAALERRGWRLAELPGDGYRFSATWELQRPGDDRILHIDFDGLDDMRTLPLAQSFGCTLRESGDGLYFWRQRSRAIWDVELPAFVMGLENEAPSGSELDGEHLASFVEAFVVPTRRERLQYVLSRRGKNARQEGSRLLDHLDRRYCKRVDGDFGLDPGNKGVFYDFRHQPRPLSLAEAIAVASGEDAIFSLVPGKLAVHWSHEGWSWLCRR